MLSETNPQLSDNSVSAFHIRLCRACPDGSKRKNHLNLRPFPTTLQRHRVTMFHKLLPMDYMHPHIHTLQPAHTNIWPSLNRAHNPNQLCIAKLALPSPVHIDYPPLFSPIEKPYQNPAFQSPLDNISSIDGIAPQDHHYLLLRVDIRFLFSYPAGPRSLRNRYIPAKTGLVHPF